MNTKIPEIFHLKILNWERYQKADSRVFHRIDNNHIFDTKIQALSDSQYRLWCVLLSLAGMQHRHGCIEILGSTLHSLARIRGKSVQTQLSKLSELLLIEIQKERKKERRERKNLSLDFSLKNKTKNTQEYSKAFEFLWEHWPSDNGDRGSKTQAYKNLNKWAENHSLEKAYEYAANYVDYVNDHKISKPYRLSNFFGEKSYWEEFKEPKSKKSKESKFENNITKLKPLPGHPDFGKDSYDL